MCWIFEQWLQRFTDYFILGENKEEIIVSTTRIETMLADSAVAVHPEDERYKVGISISTANYFCIQLKLDLSLREALWISLKRSEFYLLQVSILFPFSHHWKWSGSLSNLIFEIRSIYHFLFFQ